MSYPLEEILHQLRVLKKRTIRSGYSHSSSVAGFVLHSQYGGIITWYDMGNMLPSMSAASSILAKLEAVDFPLEPISV